MDRFHPDDILDMIVALDNEAYNNHIKGDNKQADKYRALKWKLFRLYTEMTKRDMEAA